MEHPAEPNERPSVRIAHISDTHLGYESYGVLAASGENQRSVDVARSFDAAVKQIDEWDPPLVIHSGDFGDRPSLPNRWVYFAQEELKRLACIRPDGSRRQVIILAGNHDQPAQRRERSWVDLCSNIAGVHIVSGYQPQRLTFDSNAEADRSLDCLDVVAVPHEALKFLGDVEEGLLRPRAGRICVLTSHGVAGGSSLFRRSVGREFHIPTELLAAGWAYGALGHWHRRGPVDSQLGSRIFYAGSTENMGFGDLRDNGDRRGWNQVVVSAEELPEVTQVDVPIRKMIRDRVEVGGKTPDEITTIVTTHVTQLRDSGRLDDAVVGVVVTGTTRDLWNLVDTGTIRDLAAGAFHFELICSPGKATSTDDELPERVGGDLWTALVERSQLVLPDEQRKAAVELARELLAKELKVTGEDLKTDSEASGNEDESVFDQPEETESSAVGSGSAARKAQS